MLIAARNAFLMSGAKLPYDAEVEYLESTGTQYVDTGITGNPSTTRLDISVTTPSSITSAAFLCGARGVDSAHNVTGLILVYLSGASSLWRLDTTGSFYGAGRPLSITCDTGTDYTFSMQGTACLVNGVTYSSTAVKENADSGLNVYIGTSNNNGTAAAGMPVKIRFAALWQNDTLVRDYIPVRVGSDPSAVGYLYDRANPDGGPLGNGLYPNAGTGAFVIGPDKP